MFDKLVESTKTKQGGRARRFFFLTTLIYCVLLIAVAVGTIFNFNPALAESFDLLSKLTPPPPWVGPPPPTMPSQPRTLLVQPAFVAPTRPTPLDEMPPDVERYRPAVRMTGDIGAPVGTSIPGLGIPGGSNNETVPVPPQPRPQPSPEPRPTPELKLEKPLRVTSSVLQGSALRKVQPPYPVIAKQVKAQGAVQIQINISEAGVVTGASVIDGHPLLRDAALQAARQWVFRPTELNGVPVKVVGVITFNFTLN